MTYIVNGEKVEYLRVKEEMNGDLIVEFDKKFNVVTAHIGVLMEKLRNNGLDNIHIFKNLKYKIIQIQLDDVSQLHGVLYSLDIPPLTYEFLEDDNIIVIDTVEYELALGIKNPITLSKKDWVRFR